MQKIRKTKILLLALLVAATSSSILSNSAHAANEPTVEIIKPDLSKGISPDAPFSISFNLIGGWAATAKDCNPGPGGGNPYSVALLEMDETGNSKAYIWGGYTHKNLYYMKSLTTKILTNGLRCTITFIEDPDFSGWSQEWIRDDYDGQTRDIIGVKEDQATDTGVINKIVFGIRNENTRESQVMSFNADEAASPKIEILGLNRGDEIEYAKDFSVKVDIGNSLLVKPELFNGADYGSKCENLKEVSRNSTRTQYEAKCRLVHNAIDYPLVDAYVSFKVSDGRTFYSNRIAVNFVKTGIPEVSLYIEPNDYYAPESKPGKGSVYLIKVSGRSSLRFRDGQRPMPRTTFRVCAGSECKNIDSTEEGNFSAEFKTKLKNTYVTASLTLGEALFDTYPVKTNFSEMTAPTPVTIFKSGLPKGKVDKSSGIYKQAFAIGRNFRKVSFSNETGKSQCNSAQANGMIYANGHPQFLGVQARMIMSWLRTPSGYQGCIDGFGK